MTAVHVAQDSGAEPIMRGPSEAGRTKVEVQGKDANAASATAGAH
jgi:hypothetical protein